jgi:hypothetical protein
VLGIGNNVATVAHAIVVQSPTTKTEQEFGGPPAREILEYESQELTFTLIYELGKSSFWIKK